MSSRIAVSLKTKLEIINSIDAGAKQSDVYVTFKLPKTTVNRIWKDRENIKVIFEQEQPDRKKHKPLQYDEIDSALLEWFKIQRNHNVPISGPILKAQAAEFATAFKKTEFRCSDGWLDKWKKRHAISFRVISGEGNKVNQVVTDNWIRDKWSDIRQGYKPEDIYNADETGKFWRMLPNKTLHFANETCSGGTQSKERITILFCTNSDGSDKRKPLVIGKFQNPRPFKVIKDRNSLPVEYFFNKKAWMTTVIFEAWLKRFDLEMQKKKRQIILTLDNVSSHPKDISLKNIKLVYFPPNCTSVIQPLDQGIIKNFKMKYQFLLVQKILHLLNSKLEPKINLLEAIFQIHAAWLKVTSATISNCFRHAQIQAEELDPECNVLLEIEDDVDESTQERFSQMCFEIGMEEAKSLDDFSQIDAQVLTEADPTNADIVAMFSKDNTIDEDQEEEMEFGAEEEAPRLYSSADALGAATVLKTWLLAQGVHSKFVESVNEIEQFVLENKMKKLKQRKLTEFYV